MASQLHQNYCGHEILAIRHSNTQRRRSEVWPASRPLQTRLPASRQEAPPRCSAVLPTFPLPLPADDELLASILPEYPLKQSQSAYIKISPQVILYCVVCFYLPDCKQSPVVWDAKAFEIAHKVAYAAVQSVHTTEDGTRSAFQRPTTATLLAITRELDVEPDLVESAFEFYRSTARDQRIETAAGWLLRQPQRSLDCLAWRVAQFNDLFRISAKHIRREQTWTARRCFRSFPDRLFSAASGHKTRRKSDSAVLLRIEVAAVTDCVQTWMRETCKDLFAIGVDGKVACAFECKDLGAFRRHSSPARLSHNQMERTINLASIPTINGTGDPAFRQVHYISKKQTEVKETREVMDRY